MQFKYPKKNILSLKSCINSRFYLFILAFLVGLNWSFGQSLLKDTKELQKAIEFIKSDADSISATKKAEALGTALAILTIYDQPFVEKGTNSDFSTHFKENYAENTAFDLSFLEVYDTLPDNLKTLVSIQKEKKIADNQKSARHKMLEIMQNRSIISMSDYLSFTKTLAKYQVPPIQPDQALKVAAQNGNQNLTNGLLVSEIAVIEGIFNFILSRAKDEILINFLDRLLTDETPNFKLLFPTVVAEFGKGTFNYSDSFINRLRNAFYEDLQQFSTTLPLFLMSDDYFKELQSEPIAYNFLTIYSMLGLAQQEMKMDDIIPLTYSYLFNNYQEAIKTVNLEIADSAYQTPTYQELINLTQKLRIQMDSIFLELNTIETVLDTTTNGYKRRFKESVSEFPAPKVNDFLSSDIFNLDILLEGKEKYSMSLLPYLLKGEIDTSYTKNYNTLANYDILFAEEKESKEWRAAGLDLLKQFVGGTWYNDQSVADIFYDWEEALQKYHLAVEEWIIKIDTTTALKNEINTLNKQRDALSYSIDNSIAFWGDSISPNHMAAFDLLHTINKDGLQAITNTIRSKYFDLAPIKQQKLQLKEGKKFLTQVETRFRTLDDRLYQQHPSIVSTSPARKYFTDKNTAKENYAYIKPKIEVFSKTIEKIRVKLGQLEEEEARLNSKKRDNARPILQMMESTTYLMYALHSDSSDSQWVSKSLLDDLLNNEGQRDIFLGLLQQQLGNVKGLGVFNPNGLEQLINLTMRDLPSLQTPSDTIPDSLAFYRKAAFAVNTMNRVLELPLIAQESGSTSLLSLMGEQYPNLTKITDISEQTLDFIYYLNVKDHSHAISTLIRLLGDVVENDSIATKKGHNSIKYLKNYGDFIAGLIDAQESYQVERLLDQIADPPGNSRLKRSRTSTVNLNAYLAPTFGFDNWKDKDGNPIDDTYTFAANMPVGLSWSFLVGKEGKTVREKESLSLFLSFLDLGALFSYTSGNSSLGENQLTFKNLFKFGWQAHYNIKKSPFYVGIGGQYGPHFRLVRGESVLFNANRHFLTFGIDIPIKTFYVNNK